jgi:CubicO group peptidase (beta-lactamase class C family)
MFMKLIKFPSCEGLRRFIFTGMRRCLILWVLPFGQVLSQGFDTAALNRYFDVLDSNSRFMGTVTVFRNGAAVYGRSVGHADVEARRPAGADTRYGVGSITKTFTAVLVMKSVEKGLLSLDDTVARWYPQVANAGRITVRHLLTHRSGLHNFTDNPGYARWTTQPCSGARMMDTVAAQRADFPPGEKYAYSNTGFVLLTRILEQATGKTYAELLRRWVLRPGRLRATYMPEGADTSLGRARSYAWLFGGWRRQPVTHPSVPTGAGAIRSTAADIARFANLLFDGRFISQASLDEMTRMRDNVGAGIFQIPAGERLAYGHGGRIDGFESIYIHLPREALTVTILSNGANMPFNDVTIAVMGAALGAPVEMPQFGTVSLTDAELDRYTGVYGSKQVPMKITVKRRDGKLMAQASGQSAFGLDAHGDHRFSFRQAGIEMVFDPERRSFLLIQGRGRYRFERE